MMFSSLPVQLGAYTLTSVLSEDERTVSFHAVQTTMERDVVVTVLRPEFSSGEGLTDFVSLVRAKASIQYHAMGAVYEALNTDGYWYYTREFVSGIRLPEMCAAGRTLSVAQCIKLIRVVADSCDYFDVHGVETIPLTLEHFTLGEGDVFRFANPVKCGVRDLQTSESTMAELAVAMEPLLPVNQPGQTRIRTLCEWMKNGYEGHMLKLYEIQETLDTIEAQLGSQASGPADASIATRFDWRFLWANPRHRWKVLAGGGVLAALLLVLPFMCRGGASSDAAAAVFSGKEESFVVWDGEAAYRVPLRAVSIGDYAIFLSSIERMTPMMRRKMEEGIPAGKKYEPDDWAAMYKAARTKGTWAGLPLTLDSPVVNVDYWDALAYGRFTGGLLPDKKMWGEISQRAEAQLPVRVWTGFKELDPSRTMDFDLSHAIDAGHGVLQYLPESGMRKKDLGFRIIFPK
ncbi:hypothetical protein ICN84_09935 [Akkermansia glycaniphila]|uniref:hypothetical protein n=1 Tax=Akkermansia glycaniphila TaxID=1679444 RepID=UPI001C013985|nr:hypothetical protein [Akkermansia glycaniphila]MBT9450386.1 hypothetical protein [Akkermansia glycaniphila]